ncbi:hypothetical protein CF327_g7809 [Tilletia walkeri]|nr:hypothetical protein CF327_g7809 [Tilletia walkeri]
MTEAVAPADAQALLDAEAAAIDAVANFRWTDMRIKVEHGAPRSAPYSGTPTPPRSAGNLPVEFLLRTPSNFYRF